MVVLSADPLTADPSRIAAIQVDLAVIGGRVVYDRHAAPAPRAER